MPDHASTRHTPDGTRALNYTVRRPKGVVAVICPWNLPLLLMTWKVAPGARLRQHGGGEAVGGDAVDRARCSAR